MTEWIEIAGTDGAYEVSDLGLVRSLPRKWCPCTRELRQGTDADGYRVVWLQVNGRRRIFRVHRLVLEAFNPVSGSSLLDVNHKNFDRSDNRLENLEWCTRRENIHHAIRAGRAPQIAVW
jgi:hypothetical protein